ncbi:MAG: patatin-like phospholipase family protein [Ignavibacteriaceae bacterium]|jgi:NTE family protein|nr:patatin-like phospholipase family protein [Ignavibacteriaceae bacterium]
MKKRIKILLLLTIFFFNKSFSQEVYNLDFPLKSKQLPFGLVELIPENKPQIALALSGGGARGLSQIGVLKALEESGIQADIIVGTSMGSIVGGMYAAGYSPEQLDSVAMETDWNDLLTLSNQSNRRDLFVDQKVTEDRAIFSLRLSGLAPVFPTSFNDGQKLSNHLNILALNAPLHSDASFDLLTRKFRAVCTDLITGRLVVLSEGSISSALRASSSVMFFLAPVKMDTMLLVDGGLVANIPVDVAKNNGGDFVVAINTTSGLWDEDELSTPWVIADQMVSIPMRQNNYEQLSKADFVIEPAIGNTPSTDFNNVDALISLGYKTAIPHMNELKSKIDSAIFNSLPDEEVYFKNLILDDSLSMKEQAFFYHYKNLDSVSNKMINYDLYRLLETGDYKSLSAQIVVSDSESVLRLSREYNPVIKRIDLIGISQVQSERISSVFSSLKGERFSGSKVLDALLQFIEIYRKEGFSLAGIQSIDFDIDEGRLRIFVDEGIISQIEISGNEKTNKNIITRELKFEQGDYFKIKDIKEGLVNLRSTKLFNNIDVVVKEKNGQNILTVKVDEKPSSLLRISFRSDNEYRAQFGFDLRDENFFGTGTELGLILFGGLDNRAYILEQKANRVFDTYFTYKINGFYKFNDVHVYNDIPLTGSTRFSREEVGLYRQIFYGISLGVGTQVGRFGNLILEGKYQFDQINNIDNQPTEAYKTKIVSLKASTTIDTQDKYPFTENGVYFSGYYETALSVLGGEVGYSNIGFEYKNYFKLSSSSVISPSFKFGFADKTLPLSQQYSIGGQESFFGMHDNEYRGRQIMLASLMYRYKLPFMIFFDTYLKLRYDLGSTWAFQEQIRFKDLRHGIGTSISFDTPIGPAEFAVGRSFLLRNDLPNNPISWGDVLFYFSIGYYY